MEIIIKNRYTLKIILEGDYENIKECVEKNKQADLSKADLSGAEIQIMQKDELLSALRINIIE